MSRFIHIILIFMIAGLSKAGFCQETVAFRIQIKSESGDLASSNEVEVARPFTLFVPNAFTPNGDGVNDVFRVKSKNYDYYRLRIYDRWGALLFESDQAEAGWDGTSRGERMEVGVYTYHLIMREAGGREWNKTGHVTIARND